jgi:hypothetical protein
MTTALAAAAAAAAAGLLSLRGMHCDTVMHNIPLLLASYDGHIAATSLPNVDVCTLKLTQHI